MAGDAYIMAITVYVPICQRCQWEGSDTTRQEEAEGELAAHESTHRG